MKNNNIHDALVEFYMDLKIRKLNEMNMVEEAESVLGEREILRSKDIMTIINYLKYSIEQFVEDKITDGRKTTSCENDSASYEELLRKLEGDIRSHIKVRSYFKQIEHQLKLHSDSLTDKVEELEKENSELVAKNKQLKEVILFNIEEWPIIKT